MSSISAINSITKKFSIPVEIENLIYEYLTLEDYNKPRAIFQKNFLNRMSPNYPSLTFFNGILKLNCRSTIEYKVVFKTFNYLLQETDFYCEYEYDPYNYYIEEDNTNIPEGYYPRNINVVDEDQYFMGDNIIHPEGYDNIRLLAENLRNNCY